MLPPAFDTFTLNDEVALERRHHKNHAPLCMVAIQMEIAMCHFCVRQGNILVSFSRGALGMYSITRKYLLYPGFGAEY